MRYFILISFLLCFSLHINAQSITWEKEMNFSNSVSDCIAIETEDHGFFTFSGNGGDSVLWLVKLNKYGDEVYRKVIDKFGRIAPLSVIKKEPGIYLRSKERR